jgi:hypothetical protein
MTAMLVYTRGLRGPAPEKWPEPILDMMGKERPALAKHKLSKSESKLSLNKLMAKYPPPVMGEA